MTTCTALPLDDFKSCFTAKTTVDDSPEHQRLVDRAVARAKEGDEDAIRFLYVTFSGNVYGYVRSILRDDHDAEDVTQHVFAKLMTVLVRYDRRGVPFSGWLLRLAHNAAIDQLRSRRATPVDEVRGSEETDSADRLGECSQSLREAFEALPEEQRDVVMLRHVIGLSPGEIATRLGRSESSIHGLHHRGRRTLQDELRRRGSAPSVAVAG